VKKNQKINAFLFASETSLSEVCAGFFLIKKRGSIPKYRASLLGLTSC